MNLSNRKFSIYRDGMIISDLDRKILTLNGFLNGYNDKLSLKTEANSVRRTTKEIRIDSFEYLKAKDLQGTGDIKFDSYELLN